MLIRAATACAMLAASACDGPDPPPYDDRHTHTPGWEEPDGCEEQVTVLSGIDEVSPLGIRAADMLALAAGDHASTVLWGGGGSYGTVTVELASPAGEAAISARIHYAGGEVRFIASTETPLYDWTCNDRLEVDVEVEVVTDDGALNERFTAPLRSTIAQVATLSRRVALPELQGALALTAVDPPDAIEAVQIDVGVTAAGPFGAVSAAPTAATAPNMGLQIGLAVWPASVPPCGKNAAPVPLDLAIVEYSAEDVLTFVGGFTDITLAWQDGEETALALSFAPGETACAVHAAGYDRHLGALEVPVEVAAASADGRWAAVFPARLGARPTTLGGTFDVVWVHADLKRPADDPDAAFGVQGLDVSGHERVRLLFDGHFGPDDGSTYPDGRLTVYGERPVACPPGDVNCFPTESMTLVDADWIAP